MKSTSIGIGDIGLYTPQPRVDLDWLVGERAKWDTRLGRHLKRALGVTGQRSFRFPEPWEDAATMAAQAAQRLFQTTGFPKSLRHLASGTESGLDHSKPLSAYVEGLLTEAGYPIPSAVSSLQVQHACAAGTLALMNVGALLSIGGSEFDSGLVLCSDIARYKTRTTAEVTQGSGAAAILVEANPRLLELDLGGAGYCSRDVDDFFRPHGSSVAQVRGRFSMDCYIDNLESALLDHGGRTGADPKEILQQTDYFVLHAPFREMPWIAMRALLERQLGLTAQAADQFLSSRGMSAATEPAARIGNTYTAAVYFALAAQLSHAYEQHGRAMVGKTVLLASYGSGNTMIVLRGRIADSAPDVVSRWDLEGVLGGGRPTDLGEYTAWTERTGDELNAALEGQPVPPQSFYLSGIRDDGYREHRYTETKISARAVQPEHLETTATVEAVSASG
jgi:hydroxymethylglutaryl-CoA synthase